MRILILGAGNAGRQLASRLCEEKHSVIMVDTDQQMLDIAESELDVMTICGSASSPQVLAEANVEKCQLVIAVTNCDEVNILSCLYANAAGVQKKVARVTSPEYINADDAYDLSAMGVDLVINQKQECAREIFNALRMPSTVEAFDLFSGKVMVAGFQISTVSPMAGRMLSDCEEQIHLIQQIRMIAILRDEALIVPHGDTQVEEGDLLYLIGQRKAISEFAEWSCPRFPVIRKVVIAGGGDLGLMLAQSIEDSIECILLEQDEQRARFCSEQLEKALILRADALAESTLQEAGISEQTAFVALTGNDENNIMNCLMAQKHGVKFTVTNIARTDYVPVVENLNLVNRIVSPYISTTHAILHYLRSQEVQAASLLHNLPGELLDVMISEKSPMAGKKISEIKLPKTAVVATVLRGGEIFPATGSLELLPADRLLIFSHHDAVKKIQTKYLK